MHSVVTGCCVVKIISVLNVIKDSLHGNGTALWCRPVLYWTVLNCTNRPSDLLTIVSNLTEHGDGHRARELQMELALLRLQFTYAIYCKHSARPWETAQCAGTEKKIQWLLYREIKAVWLWDSYGTQKHSVWAKCRTCIVKIGGTYSNHHAFNC